MTAWPVDPRGQVVQLVAIIITGLFFVQRFGLHLILGFKAKNHGGKNSQFTEILKIHVI